MMDESNLQNMFNDYLESKSIFNNKKALTSSFKPGDILHRDEQIEELASILAPALKGDSPSNIFIYGTVGTGKTLVVNHVAKEIKEASQKADDNLEIVYINCKMKKVADTEYRLLAQLARELGGDVPSTGLPTDAVYDRFLERLEETEGAVIIVLDEIDVLVKKAGDEFLYNFTRLGENLEKTGVSIIGISNDLNFTEYMDARVKSSLSEEEIIFPPYNALELKDILRQRCELGLHDGSLEDGVISKCAALAAKEHGDARRALDLIRVAGELAEREKEDEITTTLLDRAQTKIEKDRIVETVKSQPKHSKLTLYTIMDLCNGNGEKVATGEVYNNYKKYANELGAKCLTQRRVSDLISELDMLGVINAEVISKGRYGRTRQISMDLSSSVKTKVQDVLEDTFYF